MSINKTITTIPIKNILSHVKKPFGPPGSDRFCSFFSIKFVIFLTKTGVAQVALSKSGGAKGGIGGT